MATENVELSPPELSQKVVEALSSGAAHAALRRVHC